MKTLLIAAMLATQPATDFNEGVNWIEVCANIGDTAEGVMQIHQAGVPLSQVMGLIDETFSSESESARRFYRSVAMDAYSRTPMQNERNAERQRAAFRNEWELICWEAAMAE